MQQVLNLSFHYLTDQSKVSYAPGVVCTATRFRRHLQHLQNEDWQVVTCGRLAEMLATGEILPEKVATISFDDGLRSQFDVAFPILQAFGFPATYFLIGCALQGKMPPVIGLQVLIAELGAQRLEREILPEYLAGTAYATLLDPERYDIGNAKLGEPEGMRRIKWIFNHFLPTSLKLDILDNIFEKCVGVGAQAAAVEKHFIQPQEVYSLSAAGMEIGSHSMTHPDVTTIGRSELRQELDDSGEALSRYADILTFCWPFGADFSAEKQLLVKQYYTSAWNYLPELTPVPERYNLFNMPRYNEALIEL